MNTRFGASREEAGAADGRRAGEAARRTGDVRAGEAAILRRVRDAGAHAAPSSSDVSFRGSGDRGITRANPVPSLWNKRKPPNPAVEGCDVRPPPLCELRD